MNLEFTEEQLLLRDAANRYFTNEYEFDSRGRGQGDAFDAARWRTYSELGWLAASLPEAVGGLGGSISEAVVLQEEFGRALATDPFLGLAVLGPQALAASGDEGQIAALLPSVATGELRLALAHGELEARSDPRHVATRAERTADGYRLSGHKAVVLGGAAANRLLVSARTGGANDAKEGISLFLVDPDGPGIDVRRYGTIDDIGAADILLDDAPVTAAALVGAEGGAYPAIEYALDYAAVVACADAVGAMDRMVWTTRDYLKMRRQFGVPLASFQALQHRMADMFMDVEQSRSMVYRGISVFGQPDPQQRRRLALAAKAFVSQAAKYVGAQGIQLHGAIALTDECTVSHIYKRLFAFSVMLGSIDYCLSAFGAVDDAIAGNMER